MASEVDIANLALSHLGDDATLSSLIPPEGSAQADHCAKFYPVARDSLLEMHSWSFATKRITGSLLTSESPKWLYAYAVPANCISVQKVFDSVDTVETPCEFIIEEDSTEQSVIYTNVAVATIVYTKRVTNTEKFSPNFIIALSWHLASMLAGPVLKGDQGASESKRCTNMMGNFLALCKTRDANNSRALPTHNPAHIQARQ